MNCTTLTLVTVAAGNSGNVTRLIAIPCNMIFGSTIVSEAATISALAVWAFYLPTIAAGARRTFGHVGAVLSKMAS